MLKRTSTLVFFTCFLLSSLLWIFNTLSKKTNQSIIREINIIDIPNHIALDSLSKKHVEIKLEGYGSAMLKLFFNPKKINIEYNNIKNGIANLTKGNIHKSIPDDLNIVEIKPTELKCFFSKQTTKKIPISVKNININCKSPYKIYGSIMIRPDSIIISGSEAEINKIKEWNVKPITFENVKKNINTIIHLEESQLLANKNEIILQVNVDEFTEGEIEIPIKIPNYYEKDMKLRPQSLKIKYLVAVKNYNKISVNDFQIICDWKNINKREIKIKDVIGPDYVKIINKKNIKKQKIHIWINKI